jgi:hypothetical protein
MPEAIRISAFYHDSAAACGGREPVAAARGKVYPQKHDESFPVMLLPTC